MDTNTFLWKNTSISYSDTGEGKTLVFLHGFLETKEVWTGFDRQFLNQYRVLVPDIPGHGQSSFFGTTHSMEKLADVVEGLINHLQITECILVGHSMGGYVALAFAQKHPERISGLVLFHSSVYADSEEKKQNRLADIEKVMNGQLVELATNHFPKTFAPHNIPEFLNEIETLKIRTSFHQPEGVSALIRGMMERPDQQLFISQFKKPLLFLMGKQDNFIPSETAMRMADLNKNSQLIWLENSGHMGFIEEPYLAEQAIKNFLRTT